MALDDSRLGLENKSGPIFCVRQVYFTKSCQQIWGCASQPFILFIDYIPRGKRDVIRLRNPTEDKRAVRRMLTSADPSVSKLLAVCLLS